MQIQIKTHSSITGDAHLLRRVREAVQRALGHCSQHVTRVIVHLSDDNGSKPGTADKCCVIEARVQGHKPRACVQKAASVEQAVSGAARKIERCVASTLRRVRRRACA